MQEYLFLFGLAFIWIIFAVVQDLRTREVSNWLNFSLIAFILAYRVFYSIFTSNIWFFFYGAIGIGIFVILAYAFYYGRVFAGGDAKLLMGLGGVIPFESYKDYLFLGGGFIFLLFGAGAIWGLIYGFFLIKRNKKELFKEFKMQIKKTKYWFGLIILGIILEILNYSNGFVTYGLFIVFSALLPIVYAYSKALEKRCLIVLKSPSKLTEGDWLERDVKIGRKWIRKSVHGLSLEEIKLLRKAKKKVFIKEGIPFTPAFLIAFLAGLYFLRYSPF